MRITKNLAIATAAVVSLLSAAPLFAQGPDQPAPPQQQGNVDVTIDLEGIGLGEAGGPTPFTMPMPPPHIGVAGPAMMPPMGGDFLIGLSDGEDFDIMALGPDSSAEDVLIAAAPVGGAPGRFVAHRMRMGGGCPLSGLNLTDDQYERLFAIKKDNAGKSAAKMGEMMSLQLNMHDLMLQPEIDRTKIVALQARINTLKADLANARLDNKIAMMSVLTPEQRKDLRRNMLQRMSGGMGGMRGGWGGGWGGGRRGGPGGAGGGGHCPPGECPMPKKS